MPNSSRPIELTEFEELLAGEIAGWNAQIDVEIKPPNIEEFFQFGATVFVNDGYLTDVGRKGQGLQRALIFGLLKSLAKVTRIEREKEERDVSSFFIVEEPELFLHPQAQRGLFDSLRQLTKSGGQVFLCTHSSSFISLDRYRSICIVRKEGDLLSSSITQCREELFEEGQEKEAFNLTYWINPDRGELFLSEKVILVEGQTEKTILSLLGTKLGVFRHGYSIMDCGSKNSLPMYIKLLNKFRIPYIAVYDKDHQEEKSAEKKEAATQASQRIESSIDREFGESVVFVNDIEEELGMEGGGRNKAFNALKFVSSKEFSLPQAIREKIEHIYSANGNV